MSNEKYDQLTIVRPVEEKYHQFTIDKAKEVYSSLFYNLPIDRYPQRFPTWDELSNKDKQKWVDEILSRNYRRLFGEIRCIYHS